MTASTAAAGHSGSTRASARGRWRHTWIGWSFALPFVVIFLVFLAGPILASLLLSFSDFGLADVTDPLNVNLIGFENYAQLVGEPQFMQAAFNTAYFVVVGVPLTLAAGLLAAVGLNQGVVRFRALFRVGYYLPVVTSIVAIAVVWRYLLHPDLGLINLALGAINIEGPEWLADPVLAMPSIIAMAVWRNLGFVMVIFLAGLQTISVELYEAASIDGAGRWARFTGITLPMLRPTILFAAVITSIGYLQLFEEPFVMTAGGPLDKTISVTMYMYEQGFRFFHLGYAAAVGYVLFLAIVVLTFVYFRVLKPTT